MEERAEKVGGLKRNSPKKKTKSKTLAQVRSGSPCKQWPTRGSQLTTTATARLGDHGFVSYGPSTFVLRNTGFIGCDGREQRLPVPMMQNRIFWRPNGEIQAGTAHPARRLPCGHRAHFLFTAATARLFFLTYYRGGLMLVRHVFRFGGGPGRGTAMTTNVEEEEKKIITKMADENPVLKRWRRRNGTL